MHPSLFRGALIAAALSAQFAFDACVSSVAFAAEIKFTAPTSARLPDGGALRNVADYGDYALFAMPEDEFRAEKVQVELWIVQDVAHVEQSRQRLRPFLVQKI